MLGFEQRGRISFAIMEVGREKALCYSRRTGRVYRTSVLEVHCKKRLAIFPSPAGMSLTKPWGRGNL
jgi:hypothetical protein